MGSCSRASSSSSPCSQTCRRSSGSSGSISTPAACRWTSSTRDRAAHNTREDYTGMANNKNIAPATGRLGVLLPGMGAVATTFIAGVEAVRRGMAEPIGSLTQLSHIRLGKRTDNRTPLIRELLPPASLGHLGFGGWDPIPDDAYETVVKAGVLEAKDYEPIADFLKSIQPMPAVFDRKYVKRLDGTNVKTGKNKRDLGEQLREDIRRFKEEKGCDRLVMVWCGSTEVFLKPGPQHETLAAFEKAMDE